MAPEALEQLAFQACKDVSHLLRPGHLAQLARILQDPEASANDRFVALDLLKNANIAAGGVLPMCQDTGTAIVFGKKGQRVWVEGDEEEALSYGVHRTYTETNLRYSQMAPLSMFEEVNTGNNLPVDFSIMAQPGEHHADELHLMFVLKGGGSANKTFLFQQTRAVLNKPKLLAFLEEKIKTLGTSACPPYHLAIVIGGTSAETTLKTVKLASTRWLDSLPTEGDRSGHAFRDPGARGRGPQADPEPRHRRAVRRQVLLPRRPGGAAAPPWRLAADRHRRQLLRRPPGEGQDHPRGRLPRGSRARPGASTCRRRPTRSSASEVVRIDLNQPMDAIRAELSKHPVKTRVSLTGTMVVARDIAHAKLQERIDAGLGLPDYIKDHPVYYAGPAKTPGRLSPPAASARPPPGGWTATSPASRPPAGRW